MSRPISGGVTWMTACCSSAWMYRRQQFGCRNEPLAEPCPDLPAGFGDFEPGGLGLSVVWRQPAAGLAKSYR
jgi:hypothetical protein